MLEIVSKGEGKAGQDPTPWLALSLHCGGGVLSPALFAGPPTGNKSESGVAASDMGLRKISATRPVFTSHTTSDRIPMCGNRPESIEVRHAHLVPDVLKMRPPSGALSSRAGQSLNIGRALFAPRC